MAYKFLFIGKANAEIERLTAELATVTKERDEAKAALESNNSEAVKAGEDLQGQLTVANAAVESLTGQVNELKSELETTRAELKAAKETIANPSAQIVKIASVKAAEITGAQGQPAIAVEPQAGEGTPGSGGGLLEQLNAIKDPQARTEFYRKNRKAIEAAWRPGSER